MSQQEVHGINRRKRPTREGQPCHQQQNFGLKNTDATKSQDERRQKNMKEQRHQECSKCGRRHSKTDKCPVQGKQCNKCDKDSPSGNQALCTLLVGSKQKSVKFKLDTGSQVNILPKSAFDSPNETLSAYDNNRLESLGRCHLRCVHKKDRYKKQNTLDFM